VAGLELESPALVDTAPEAGTVFGFVLTRPGSILGRTLGLTGAAVAAVLVFGRSVSAGLGEVEAVS
ncbi:MAG TPA: hypothetical protein VFD73_03485, partial [Gemmatimonadales bacterium]|nr:hypothetical protein [Gemmatimonadales bacterium]